MVETYLVIEPFRSTFVGPRGWMFRDLKRSMGPSQDGHCALPTKNSVWDGDTRECDLLVAMLRVIGIPSLAAHQLNYNC